MFITLILSAVPAPQDTWGLRPLPSVCRATPSPEAVYELLGADHLPFSWNRPGPPAPPEAPVPGTLLLQLLDDQLRSLDPAARLELGGDSLFVQGPPAVLGAVDATLDGFRQLEEQLRIDWEVRLVVGAAEPVTWSGHSRSGERIPLGGRRMLGYLGSQDVNVATDTGVAEPEAHYALLGSTLHLTFSRLQDGDRLIEGCLDVADLRTLGSFDPETPDLGPVQLPEVATAQVRFAARNGATVLLSGLPEPLDTVSLVVRTTPTERSDPSGPWRAYDVAGLTRRPPRPLPVSPGELGVEAAASTPRPAPSYDAGALAAMLAGGTRGEDPPIWGGSLILVRAGSRAADHADQLLTALEESLHQGTVTLSSGRPEQELRASFPVIAGLGARLTVGVERRLAIEVGTQLAPSTWMPILEVKRTFDGLLFEGNLGEQGLSGSLRETAGAVLDEHPEEDNRVATFQRLERHRRGRAVLLSPAASATEVLPASGSGSAVLLRIQVD